MWFIADIFERYTTSVAKTFVKLAAMEAEANRRALQEMQARRKGLIVPQREIVTVAPLVHPHEGVAITADNAKDFAVHVPEGDVEEAVAAAGEASSINAAAKTAERPMPIGVRGDVVIRWLEMLANAPRKDMAETLEKLRKDKKVRVAELRMICAEALGEPPQQRKKAEHLETLRSHFLPSGRPARVERADIHATH
ncbi:MAG: hypothetical protein AAF318_00630 [Pseudomonadota bacterium]